MFTARNLISALSVLIMVQSTALATEDFVFHNAASFGYFNYGDHRSNALFWQGNMNAENFFLGVDINLLLTKRRFDNVDGLVIRRLEYDDGTKGFLYGPLTDYSMGQGLVLRNFSSLDRDTVLFTNSNMALRMYSSSFFDMVDIETFGTWDHVYGIRLAEDVFDVTFGQTYVSSAGRDFLYSNDLKEEERLPQSVGAFDIDAPLFGDIDFRAEAASMKDHGGAFLAGFHWGYNIVAIALSADLQWRKIDAGFAPNYFGSLYSTDPIIIGSLEAASDARQGFYGSLDGSVFNYFNVTFAYETYDRSNGAFYVDAWLKVYEKMRVSAFLKQPTLAEYRLTDLREGQIYGGSIKFDLSPNSYVSTSFKKGYDPRISAVQGSTLLELGVMF